MSADIHPTALVDSGAELGRNVVIGPYAVVHGNACIGDGTRVGAHTVIFSGARIGKDNDIHPFCSIGNTPQDKKYGGEETLCEIGDGNTIRECCTINIGTVDGGGLTKVGSQNWIMAYVHVAHDVTVGDNTIFANMTQLAGHVVVGDFVTLGGCTLVHQFCRIGSHAMTGISTVVRQDVPTYALVADSVGGRHVSVNVEGLKRRDFSPDDISAIREAYRWIYSEGLRLEDAAKRILGIGDSRPLAPLAEFLSVAGRGIVRPSGKRDGDG